MSIVYICDNCKKSINNPNTRVVLQANLMDSGKKIVKHFHKTCYLGYIQPAIDGKNYKEDVSEIPDSIKVLESSSNTDDNEEEQEALPNVVSDFNTPQVIKHSAYFTVEKCFHVHRFIALGARAVTIAKRCDIPYQTTVNYVRAFNKECINKYTPTNPISTLEKVIDNNLRQLPKLKALLATCSWSIKDAANECDMDEKDAQVFFDDLPWFLVRWDGIISKLNISNQED